MRLVPLPHPSPAAHWNMVKKASEKCPKYLEALGLLPNIPTPNIAYTDVEMSMTKKVFNTGLIEFTRALKALSKVSPKFEVHFKQEKCLVERKHKSHSIGFV